MFPIMLRKFLDLGNSSNSSRIGVQEGKECILHSGQQILMLCCDCPKSSTRLKIYECIDFETLKMSYTVIGIHILHMSIQNNEIYVLISMVPHMHATSTVLVGRR